MAKKTFSFKQENNYDQVDAIKVIKIMKSKSLKKHNNLPVKNIKKCSKAEKIQYQALLQIFSPNPGTCPLCILQKILSYFNLF